MYVAERNMGMMRPSSTVLPLFYAPSMGQFLPSRSDRNYLASFVYFLCHTTEKSIARISLVIISRMKVNQIILIFIVTSNIELKTEVCSFEVFEQSLVFFFFFYYNMFVITYVSYKIRWKSIGRNDGVFFLYNFWIDFCSHNCVNL